MSDESPPKRVCRPPRLARWLVRAGIPAGPSRDGLYGDLEERYQRRLVATTPGLAQRLAADFWYAREAALAALVYRGWVRRRVRFSAHGGLRPGRDPAGFVRELRLAGRQLARTPAFTIAAVLTIALGTAATASIFAVVNGVILAPLPFPDPDRLVVIEHRLPGYPIEGGEEVTFGAFQGQVLQYLERSRTLDEVGAYGTFDGAITEPEAPGYVRFAYATAGFFRALGVEPLYGRLFDDDEPDPAEAGLGVAVLGHGLAVQRYGGAPGVVGETLETEGFEREVVGVLAGRLSFPPQIVDVWNPRSLRTLEANQVWTVDALVGRMAPGASAASVERELAGLVAEIPERFPATAIETVAASGRMAPRVTPMKEWLVGDVDSTLWLLLASAAGVMAICCVNVANLLLVRTDSRRAELAVRAALGAGRWRLVRYFLAESLVLCAVAVVLGAAGATLGLGAFRSFPPAGLPRLHEIDAGAEIVGTAAALGLMGVAIFALVPLLSRGFRDARWLRVQPQGQPIGRRQIRVRHLLVGLQLAMAVVLLIGAGLVLRSFHALTTVDPGFDAEGVLSFRVPFPFQEIQEGGSPDGRATPFYDEVADRLAALPGVASVGYGVCLPLADVCELDGYPVKPEGLADVEVEEQPLAGLQPTAPGFLETLRVPLLAGRPLERNDHRLRTNAVLINTGLAERLWPGQDPLGRRIEQGGGSSAQNHHFTVVGVVGDIRFDALRNTPEWIVYAPVRQQNRAGEIWSASFVVRSDVPPLSLVPQVRGVVAELRDDVPVADVATMPAVVSRSMADERLRMSLLAAAALAALGLSAIGVYGTVSYVVGLRQGELGIRMALGAEDRQLCALIMREGAATLAGGLAAGFLVAAATGRVLAALLYETEPTDPFTYGLVGMFLLATAGVAAYLPARRASRLSPATVLRQ